jgi:hypothetical protein
VGFCVRVLSSIVATAKRNSANTSNSGNKHRFIMKIIQYKCRAFFKLDGGAMFGGAKSMWNKINPSDENNVQLGIAFV